MNSGFTSAVAILIVASQIKDLIGVKAAGTTLVDMIISISKDIKNFQLGDTWLGIICIVIILLLRVSIYIKRVVAYKYDYVHFVQRIAYAGWHVFMFACF